ncbi:Mn2+ and Fe2+ transporters of the NRAMP family [Fodinibius salinus]|uniref:Mn2+ and Fe2+ transporters of the NRAMP family n=1 Tax=Fodinibius salinus TaxID=860790 RepID=A0A5D3YNG6_9BACT|nr:Nramp family divalent metal transporter [Fodinibius salinus]TYP93689.1 Mn2+ and Fe2+ transporters of the NRAMP family [Fodinibius salinus]
MDHIAEDKYQEEQSSWEGIKQSLGPGLLMAAAAIGVSHLVQSTRAGATYGWALVWAVLLANFFKYPFLEYGPRYAIATGESMIEGYDRLGKWAIGIFVVFTIGTMFAVQAAVTIVSASLAAELTGIALSPLAWSAILLVICIVLLMSGQYSALDGAIKLIMAVLAVSTIVAVVAALFEGGTQSHINYYPSIWDVAGVSFLIALMGWMPIPIDAAAWHSLWTLEREEQTNYKPKLKESLFDFNIGYIGAAFLSLGFLALGALVMYGSGEEYASSGAVFASQLIGLYTESLGNWAYVIIVICAFTTMFSTTLTVTDAYPRVSRRMLEVLMPQTFDEKDNLQLYRILLVVISALSLGVLYFLGDSFTLMVDLATTLSFLTAPVLAYLNYRLVTAEHMPADCEPKPWLKWLSWSGIIFLTGFALLYIYWIIPFG